MIGYLVERVRDVFGEPPTADLEEDLVFDALANERRREILRQLADADRELTIRQLTEHVAMAESDVSDRDDLPEKDRKAVYVSIYQGHLPKLEAMEMIEYDADAGTVAPNAATSAAADTLGDVTGHLEREVIA